MILQQGENTSDVTFICMITNGVILLISYILFAYWVTHKGDFYHIRRWKASIWLASITAAIFWGALLIIPVVLIIINSSPKNIIDMIWMKSINSSAKNIFEFFGLVVGSFLSMFNLVVPLLFIVTLGTYHQLKWWLISDDYLDKIWKDPNKGHKSPIREL